MGTAMGDFTMRLVPASRMEGTAQALMSSIRTVLFHTPRKLGMEHVMEMFILSKNVAMIVETARAVM